MIDASIAIPAPRDRHEPPLDVLPAPVAAATWCAEDGHATRRVFSGRVIFAIECPGNNAPFPADAANPDDVLSNIGWQEDGIVSDPFIDPEAIGSPCRHEARWRLEGPEPEPVLLFWRETKDCDGKGGWTVLVGG